MYRKGLTALLVVLTLTLTLSATAQGREGEPPDRKQQSPLVRVIRFLGSIFAFEPTPPHP